MSNIEDFLETISYIPVDMRRNLWLLRELENKELRLYEGLQEWIRYQQQLLQLIKTPAAMESDLQKIRLKDRIERTQLQILAMRREKIQVAKQTHDIVQKFNKEFDSEAAKFEEEFKNLPVNDSTLQQMQEELPQATRNGQLKRNREPVPSYQQLATQYDPQYQYPTFSKKKSMKKIAKAPLAPFNNEEFTKVETQQEWVDNNVYCVCQQPSYGDMIACEGPSCQYRWYHFGCLNIKQAPEGAFFCPDCEKR